VSLDTAGCLDRIRDVRAAATEYGSAYLLRMRLQRMAIGVHALLGKVGHIPECRVTKLLVVPDAAQSPAAFEVAKSKVLAQRSATLDERWEDGWEELRELLDRLETLLIEMSGAACPLDEPPF
jgi:hypothetical protein